MCNKLYIHIGLAKTGTTAIQNFLTANSAWLLKKGISYKVSPGMNSHYDLQMEIRNGHFNQFEYLVNSQFDNNVDTVILSSEFFPGILNKIKENCGNLPKTRIIVYLRRQDYWLESMYAQEIKRIDPDGMGKNTKGITKTFSEWLEDKLAGHSSLKWKRFLTFCEKSFGLDNLIVKVFEKEKFVNQNIFDDFLNIFAIKRDIDCKEPSVSTNNLSFPFEILEIIRLANQYYEGDMGLLIRTLEKFNSKNRFPKISIASNATRKKILNIVSEENMYVANHFLKHKDGHLFSLDIPNEDRISGETIQQNGSIDQLMPTYMKLLKFMHD